MKTGGYKLSALSCLGEKYSPIYIERLETGKGLYIYIYRKVIIFIYRQSRQNGSSY